MQGVEGVEVAEGSIQRYAQIVTPTGEVVKTQGAPTLGVSWSDSPLSGLTIKEGVPPNGADQVAIDKATADREDIKLGDEIKVITDTGTYPANVTTLVGSRRHRRLRRRDARRLRSDDGRHGPRRQRHL